MVIRVIHKNLVFGGIVLSVIAAIAGSILMKNSVNAATCTEPNASCEAADTNFQINVGEFIAISLDSPENWATGEINTLLRNKVVLNVETNYPGGFQAYMASKDDTNLVNQTKELSYIETLSAATTAGAFPTNRWGYSLDDTDAGTDEASYRAMRTSAISLISKAQSENTTSRDVYFGAKAGMNQDSGTYANTVVFTVVSGVVDDIETPDDDPVVPRDTETTNPSVAYDSSNDRTVYTSTSTQAGTGTGSVSGSKNTTTTHISKGDTTSSYAPPHGVSTSSVGEGTPLATGLAITAGIAAMTGIGFFIAAKRGDNDDENKNK